MSFDSATFLANTQVEGKLETQFTPIPAREYIGLIQKIEAKEQQKPDNTGVWTIADIHIAGDDAAAKEATGRASPTVRDSLFLDLENGKLATGKNKNIALGRYLEATGQNGVVGNPFQLLLGKMVKIQVANEPDKKDPSKIYSKVKAVGKAM